MNCLPLCSVAAAAEAPMIDSTQAAYERAQQEIDRVLGPRQPPAAEAVPGVIISDRDKRRWDIPSSQQHLLLAVA